MRACVFWSEIKTAESGCALPTRHPKIPPNLDLGPYRAPAGFLFGASSDVQMVKCSSTKYLRHLVSPKFVALQLIWRLEIGANVLEVRASLHKGRGVEESIGLIV